MRARTRSCVSKVLCKLASVGTVGLLAIAIGLTGFRRGERWAWVAIAVFALAGILTAVIDQLA